MDITIIAEIVGIFVAIVGGVWVLGKVLSRRAYDDGAHSKDHENITEDVQSAHDKLRIHDAEISDLRAVTETHCEVHKSILKNQDHMNSRLDKIYEILVAKK